jgi:hypothetical protein
LLKATEACGINALSGAPELDLFQLVESLQVQEERADLISQIGIAAVLVPQEVCEIWSMRSRFVKSQDECIHILSTIDEVCHHPRV